MGLFQYFSWQSNDQPLNSSRPTGYSTHNSRDVASKQVSKAQVRVQVQCTSQQLDTSLLTYVYKTKQFADLSDYSEDDNRSKIAGSMHFHSNNYNWIFF